MIGTFAVGQVQSHPLKRPNLLPASFTAPVLPPGVSRKFQSKFLAIEELIQQGKYGEAKQAVDQMPKQRVTILWDDTNVPIKLRKLFKQARDAAIDNWKAGLPLSVQIYTPNDRLSHPLNQTPEIKFEFEPVLNKPQGASEPISIASFWGIQGKEPHYDVVIGLKRGIPLAPTTALEIGNDVPYALSRYWGLAKSPIIGSFAYRVQGQTAYPNTGIQIDKQIADANINAVGSLSQVIQKKEKMIATHSGLFINPEKIDVNAKTIEGDLLAITFQITNYGNGTLQMRLIPDCSCFSADDSQPIAPGQSLLYHVNMDTSQYFGSVHKELYLMTNDPNRPAMTIPVDVRVTPRYRFLTPYGTSFESENGQFVNHIFLTTDGGPLKIVQYSLSGNSGTVSMKPWTGILPDPGQHQGPMKRSGYEFTVHCGPHLLPMRNMFTLNVLTDDSHLPVLHSTFSVNYGIRSTPESIDLGQMDGGPTAVLFSVERDGKPFKVTGMTCSVSHFKVTRYSTTSKKVIFKLSYDGLKIAGKFEGVILIHTNDPKQPVVQIPLQGIMG